MTPLPNGEQMPRPGDPAGHQLTDRLLERYASEGAGPELDADAARLIDAYLNDPYLTR